jgi:hypothetical protein
MELQQVCGHRSSRQLVDVRRVLAVDGLNEFLDRSRSVCERREDLALAHRSMLDVVVELPRRIEHDGPVSRIDRPRIKLLHPVERTQIRYEVALWRVDNARSATEHRIAGEQGSNGLVPERDVIRRVTGGRDGGQRHAVAGDGVAVA